MNAPDGCGGAILANRDQWHPTDRLAPVFFSSPPAPRGFPRELRRTLRDYGLTKRRLAAAKRRWA